MASGTAPRTEQELLKRLPPSNIPGVLPRDLLPATERVLFETRASFLSMFWGRLVFIGFLLFLFFAASALTPSAAAAFLVLEVPLFLWILHMVLQWRHRIYALTDQRVIRISGVSGGNFLDAAYLQIQNLSSGPSEIRFDITPPNQANSGSLLASLRRKVIVWDSLSQAPRVYTFIQEAFAFGLRQSQLQASREAAVDHLEATSLTCAYCGATIEIATMDPANPRCPSCSAPVSLPS